MSSLLKEIYWLLHIKKIRTIPYHPQTDGLVERFNGTLKSMLRKFVSQSKRIGMNTFLTCYLLIKKYPRGQLDSDLLYGRHVRGLLYVLKEDWTRSRSSAVLLATYIIEM